MSISIVLLHPSGDKKLAYVNDIDTDTLCKKCKFKKNDNFECIHTESSSDGVQLHIYGKTAGRTPNESDILKQYDINVFGTACVIGTSLEHEPVSIPVDHVDRFLSSDDTSTVEDTASSSTDMSKEDEVESELGYEDYIEN